MPVSPNPWGKLCLAVTLSIFFFDGLLGQTLLSGPRLGEVSDYPSTNHVWLQYANSFHFKDDMSIDTDMGNIFYTGTGMKRLNVRSTFKYHITENFKIGAGMGFFWFYDTPDLMQELRFNQLVSYYKDFESGIMQHDLQLEQQIQQSLQEGDDFHTRLRYRFGYTFPTEGNIYFGVYDEIFALLGAQDEPASFLQMNRAGALIGYNTFNFFRIEANIMMQDTFLGGPGGKHRAWVFQLGVRQII